MGPPPRWPAPSLRRALCLGAVFAVGKGAVLALRLLDSAARTGERSALLSIYAPAALLAQDALAALAFLAIDLTLCRLAGWAARDRGAPGPLDRVLWLAYAAAALYVAGNVPVARVMGTPLTYAILGAAGGALADSLRVYLTPLNVLAVALVLGAAWLLPRALRPRRRTLITAALLWAALLALGPAARARVETSALHRNALLALAQSYLAQLAPRSSLGGAPPPRVAALPPLPGSGDEEAPPSLARLQGALRGRSVLWVVLESTAAQYLRPYGAAEDPMPTLSALAERALLFESAYTAYPESIKGLFAALCSAHPAAHAPAAAYTQAALPCTSLAQRLADAGYRTAMFHSGWFLYLGMQGIVRERGFQVLQDAGDIGGAYASSFGVDEATTVSRLLAFVDGAPRGQRFFIMYLPIAGHHPYAAPGPADRPRPFSGQGDLSRYLNDLHAGDAALGALVREIDRRGLAQQTLWVISGDHGEAFFQHEGNLAHTLHIYEENVRVPLLLLAPGAIERQQRVGRVASVLDIAPTVLDLVGVPAPPGYQGRSLLRPGGGPAVARFFVDQALWQVGLRQGPLKFIHEMESGRSRLYDLRTDAAEREDLSAAQPALVARLRDHLRDWALHQQAWVAGR